MKILSESFAYKEEQRHGLMADRRCGVKGRLFFFSFCRRKRMQFTKQAAGIWLCMWGSFVALGETSKDVEY